MKRKLPLEKRDPHLDWHEWFAWYPVIVRERGWWTVHDLGALATYLVWWEYVLRRKMVINSEVHWVYEER